MDGIRRRVLALVPPTETAKKETMKMTAPIKASEIMDLVEGLIEDSHTMKLKTFPHDLALTKKFEEKKAKLKAFADDYEHMKTHGYPPPEPPDEKPE